MKRIFNRFLLVAGLIFFVSVNAYSETLILKSGKKIQGRVIREAEQYIMFKDDTTSTVEGYLRENIQTIVKDKESTTISDSNMRKKTAEVNTVPFKHDTAPTPGQGDGGSNLLRIYGTEILDENAPTDQYDFSDDPTFYVKKEKESPEKVVEKMVGDIVEENMHSPFFLVGSIAGAFLLYMFFCGPFYLIAKKTQTPHSNLAWVPIGNLYLLCKIAGRPGWWFFLLFIPLVNIVIITIIWMKIAAACERPSWIGILILVPVVSFFVQWYLALCKTKEAEKKEKKVAMIDEEKEEEAKEQALFDQIVPTQNKNKPTRF